MTTITQPFIGDLWLRCFVQSLQVLRIFSVMFETYWVSNLVNQSSKVSKTKKSILYSLFYVSFKILFIIIIPLMNFLCISLYILYITRIVWGSFLQNYFTTKNCRQWKLTDTIYKHIKSVNTTYIINCNIVVNTCIYNWNIL